MGMSMEMYSVHVIWITNAVTRKELEETNFIHMSKDSTFDSCIAVCKHDNIKAVI